MNEAPPDRNADRLTIGHRRHRRPAAVSVTTGARLHFGLLDVAAPFGGIGVMVDRPQTMVAIKENECFRCADHLRERIEPIARRLSRSPKQDSLPACEIRVDRQVDPHHGLGSGTQLSMAVAEALKRFLDPSFRSDGSDCQSWLAVEIALRGQRSAVGVHGYFHGGLIYETGRAGTPLNPIVRRLEVPAEWRIGLFRPRQPMPVVSGEEERTEFARLRRGDASELAALRGIIENELLPSVDRADFERFAVAVQQYNRRSGNLFSVVQGGAYNGPAVSELIKNLVAAGAQGVGQSSWGPTVFTWFESEASAAGFVARLGSELADCQLVTPLNRGRQLAIETH